MKAPHGISVLAILALSFAVSGCGRWAVEGNDGPLNGPGSQSPTFVRKKLMPEGWSDERAWSRRGGQKVRVYDVAKRIDSYCERLPQYEHWTRLQASIDSKQLRFAPAKFWIVSIDPIAVVMTPFIVANPDRHSLSELSGAKDEQKALVSSTLANSFNYGSRIEGSASIQWFVVEANNGVSSQEFDGDELRLTYKDMVIILKKSKDGVVEAQRVSK